MAVYMNAKGTTNTSFQYGRRGAKIFGGVATPTDSEVSTGDIWLDKTNNQTKIAYVNSGTVTWNRILTDNYGDVTITGNLTVQGTQTTVNSTTVEVQNAMVFEGSTADAHETTLTTVEPTADRTVRLPNASGTLVLSGAIDVEDLKSTAYVAQGDTWNSDDSELATTGRIDQMIGTEIANSTVIMHTTGAETMAGVKTFSNGIVSDVTGDVTGDLTGDVKDSGSVVLDASTGALTGTVSSISNHNTDSLSEGSTNLYYTGARARNSISLVDNGSGELSYNSSTGVFTWDGIGTVGASGSNTQIQFNDGGSLAGDSDFVFDKSTDRLTVKNLTVNSQFNLTSDYGSVSSAVTVTDNFGSVANDTREPTPHDSYTVSEAGSITGMSAGDMIFISNETGGATMAFYDGSNWRRVQDRAVIS